MSGPAIVSLIATVNGRGALVRRDGVHYRRPGEIERIAQLTKGRAVIVGRRTFGALSMIPPDRWFLVLTRDDELLEEGGVRFLSGHGYWFMPNFADALHSARNLCVRASAPEIFVAGGPGVFAEALPLAGRVYRIAGEAPPIERAPALPAAETAGWRRLLAEARPPAAPAFEIIERAG